MALRIHGTLQHKLSKAGYISLVKECYEKQVICPQCHWIKDSFVYSRKNDNETVLCKNQFIYGFWFFQTHTILFYGKILQKYKLYKKYMVQPAKEKWVLLCLKFFKYSFGVYPFVLKDNYEINRHNFFAIFAYLCEMSVF